MLHIIRHWIGLTLDADPLHVWASDGVASLFSDPAAQTGLGFRRRAWNGLGIL